MYVQAKGWQQGRKDKIYLDADTLLDKAGLYTCPPLQPHHKSFHATLQVRSEPINVRHAFHFQIRSSNMDSLGQSSKFLQLNGSPNLTALWQELRHRHVNHLES
jgi:hypothetical protein